MTLAERRYDQLTINCQPAAQRVRLDLLRKFELLRVLPLAQLLGRSFFVPALDLDPVFLGTIRLLSRGWVRFVVWTRFSLMMSTVISLAAKASPMSTRSDNLRRPLSSKKTGTPKESRRKSYPTKTVVNRTPFTGVCRSQTKNQR